MSRRVDVEGDRVEGMARLGHHLAPRVLPGLTGPRVDLEHAVCVAVVGRDDERPFRPFDCSDEPADLDVHGLDRDADRLARRFGTLVETMYSTTSSLDELVLDADLVIGAVLVKGDRAPRLVTADMVKQMRPGSVLVDVAIDQGGCFETSRATTHEDPTYVIDDVVHYCVANMPGAVPKTSTYALNNATLPFTLALADKGVRQALLDDPHFLGGLNVCCGSVTEEHVATELGYDYVEPATALAAK